LLPLVVQQMTQSRAESPRVLNVSGGLAQSASLRQLSAWCAARFGAHAIEAEPRNRPFDVPWLVLDSSRARQGWGWQPEKSLEAIWAEIAEHAEQNPDWLEITAGA
jgi:CDP-paratose 2-epimerase